MPLVDAVIQLTKYQQMSEKVMEDQEYIPVDLAREQLGIGPKDMSLLLEVNALRYRRDPHNQTIRWIYAKDIRDAVEYLAQYRQQEEEWKRQFLTTSKDESEYSTRLKAEASL